MWNVRHILDLGSNGLLFQMLREVRTHRSVLYLCLSPLLRVSRSVHSSTCLRALVGVCQLVCVCVYVCASVSRC